MEALVEKPSKKASFGSKSIKNNGLGKVKKTISPEKELLISEFKEAIAELNLIRAGKKEARNARELIDEL